MARISTSGRIVMENKAAGWWNHCLSQASRITSVNLLPTVKDSFWTIWYNPPPRNVYPYVIFDALTTTSQCSVIVPFSILYRSGDFMVTLLFVSLPVAVTVSMLIPFRLQQQYGLFLYVNLEIPQRVLDRLIWSLLFLVPLWLCFIGFLSKVIRPYYILQMWQ
jgi:hypothetical protein